MSHHVIELVRRRRSRFITALSLILVAGVGLVVVPSLASASPTPAGAITAGRAYMPTLPAPADPTKYSAFVVKNVAFNVPFSTGVPLSTTSSTKLTLTVDSGRNKVTVLGTFDLAPNEYQGEITAASGLPTPANGVTLTISVKGSTVTPGTTTVDVVGKFVTSGASLTGIGAGGGEGVPCTPTSTVGDQTCGDLIIPAGTIVPEQLLTQGPCTADCKYTTGGSVLQWLATLTGVDNSHPVVFVAKCDKSLCAGKGIKFYTVTVQTDLTHAPEVSQPCASKGVVDAGKDFCTDYVQSTRDGAGDVLLYVLFAADAKIIW